MIFRIHFFFVLLPSNLCVNTKIFKVLIASGNGRKEEKKNNIQEFSGVKGA